MTEANEGYYTDVESALKGFQEKNLEYETKDFEGSLDEYISRITNINSTAIEKMIARVKEWDKEI